MKRTLLFLITISWLSVGNAGNEPTLVVQVPETFYQHPTRLFHPRIDYWHNRGKAAEEVGVVAFQAHHFKTSSCKTEPSGQALVVIFPNVSHNLQMGMYHSDITVKVYTSPAADAALGEPSVTEKAQGQTRGWVSYNSDSFIYKSHQQAFDKVIEQLKKNTVFQQALENKSVQNFKALCDSVNTLSQP